MNVILFDPSEVAADGLCRIRDHRLEHLRTVLQPKPGDRLVAGLVDGPLGRAELLRLDASEALVRCRFDTEAPARGEDTLVLGIPRPNILARVLEAAVTLGFGRIVLLRTRLVDKSQLQSHGLRPEALQQRIRKGLEQSVRTARPEIVVESRFVPFIEDRPAEWNLAEARFVAHPGARHDLRDGPVAVRGPFTLAIGPERGFTDHEVGKFTAAGFHPVRSGQQPLRVETAVCALTAQLQLSRACSVE